MGLPAQIGAVTCMRNSFEKVSELGRSWCGELQDWQRKCREEGAPSQASPRAGKALTKDLGKPGREDRQTDTDRPTQHPGEGAEKQQDRVELGDSNSRGFTSLQLPSFVVVFVLSFTLQ